ncbi:MAG: hypothetical protein M3Y33_12920 [Actinomycetota bacterium]|nr:hypothetical protein [Actinomycetota bacterium]
MRNARTLGASTGIALLAIAALAGCSSGQSAAQQEGQASAGIEQSFLLNQPPPHFQHSDIRATAISIEAIQALGEQTTTFAFQQGDPNPIWSCPSLGEPLASTTEITNPTQVQNDSFPNGGAAVPVGNMDPNGIYPGNSAGTYVLCVGQGGKPYAQYWEGNVDSVSGPARWDAGSRQIVVTGAPTMPACTMTAVGKKAGTTCSR